MSTTLHMSLDVAGILTWPDRDLRRHLGIITRDGRRCRDVRELRTVLVGLLADGIRMLPYGEPCEGWSNQTGCPGHESKIIGAVEREGP